MHCEQRGCHEQEGEFQRLGNADEHRGEAHGQHQGENLFTLLGPCGGVEGRRDTCRCEHLGVAVQCEAAAGEELTQGLVALREFAQVGRPVLRNAVGGYGVAEHERRVDEVVQTGRDEEALQEGVDPHTERTRGDEEPLHAFNTVLGVGPQQGEEERDGEHEEEAHGVHVLGALENTQEVGQLLVEPAVMYPHHDGGDNNRTKDTGVNGLNTGDHFQAGTGGGLGNIHSVVELEDTTAVLAPVLEHCPAQVVEGQVDHASFEHGACVCGLSERNRQAEHEEQLHLSEDGPGTREPDIPDFKPHRVFIS